jgi:hypothetical protein
MNIETMMDEHQDIHPIQAIYLIAERTDRRATQQTRRSIARHPLVDPIHPLIFPGNTDRP